MIFSTEMLHTMKLLRQCFKSEGLGILRLSDPELLDNILAMARISDNKTTKTIAYELLREAGMPISLKDLYPVTLNSPNLPKTYRGISIRGRETTSEEQGPERIEVTSKSGMKVYRGSRVA